MIEIPQSFEAWEDSRTGLIFSCPEDWPVSATDLGIVMLCERFAMPVTIKVFRIAGFERSDDPRLYQRFVSYLSPS